MSAIQKEKIYIELRKYHLEEFPTKMSTELMDNRLREFRGLEDSIITMLLGLVNGKRLFMDFSKEIRSFKKKVSISRDTSRIEDLNRNLFNTKVSRLWEIVQIAEGMEFQLKQRKGFN